jgi:hypothetical protein
MNQNFKISYKWEKLEEPDYYEPWVDVEQVYNSFSFFLTQYSGKFKIDINGNATVLNLDPDLITIFKYIPTVLETLEENTDTPVMFHFFEQGTALGMLMERQGSYIDVRFEMAPGTSINHIHMPQTNSSVPAHEFLSEWAQLMKDILKDLLQLQPELASDDSYVKYFNRINSVSDYAAKLKTSFGESSTDNAAIDSAQQNHSEQTALLKAQQCLVEYYWEELETRSNFVEKFNEDQLSNCLSYFIAHHKGQILGDMGGERFCLDLQKDLQAVFKSLPSVLTKLTNDTDDLVKLDISENDLALFLSRKGDEISALFAIPSRTEEGYEVLSDSPNSMPAYRFLEQWTRFIRDILATLTKQNPTLVEDKSYQEYVSKVAFVEDALSKSLVAS